MHIAPRDREHAFYGIAVSPAFFEKMFDSYADILAISACYSAHEDGGWHGLLADKRGIRALVLQHTGDIYNIERRAVWERLAGRSNWDFGDYTTLELRTAPKNWELPLYHGGNTYLMRPGDPWWEPDTLVFEVNLALPVFHNKLALAPWLINTNLNFGEIMPLWDEAGCTGNNLELFVEFTGAMYTPHPTYRVSGHGGCWVDCESWTTGAAGDTTRLEFMAASV